MYIVKKDGSKETFDPGKIARVTEAAGLTHDQAKSVAQHVVDWIQQAKNHEVTTLEVRQKVIDELNKLNTNAANEYAWYESTKEMN